jgi:hypothetical protein
MFLGLPFRKEASGWSGHLGRSSRLGPPPAVFDGCTSYGSPCYSSGFKCSNASSVTPSEAPIACICKNEYHEGIRCNKTDQIIRT